MARIRTIKPEFWTDSKTGTLTDKATKLFIGLLSHCDDYGVIKFDIAEFSAKIFPFENFREHSRLLSQVLTDEILPKGLAIIFSYSPDDENVEQYLWIKNFEKHQKVDKPGKPMLPSWKCGDNPKRYAEKHCSEYNELRADNLHDSENIRENSRDFENIRLVREGNRNSNNPPSPLSGGSDDLEETSDEKPKTETPVKKNKTELPPDQKSFFDRFYQAYPKHVAKEDAVRAWKKISPPPTDDFVNTLIAKIDVFRKTDGWIKNNGEFIPNPATWLNGKRWEDETPAPTSNKSQTKEPIPPSRRFVVAGDPEIYANRDQELWDRMTD